MNGFERPKRVRNSGQETRVDGRLCVVMRWMRASWIKVGLRCCWSNVSLRIRESLVLASCTFEKAVCMVDCVIG